MCGFSGPGTIHGLGDASEHLKSLTSLTHLPSLKTEKHSGPTIAGALILHRWLLHFHLAIVVVFLLMKWNPRSPLVTRRGHWKVFR
jgi:hypothetical protein